MTPEPAQPAEAWLNDPASLESGEPAQPAESPEARALLALMVKHFEKHGVPPEVGEHYRAADRILAATTARPTERGAVDWEAVARSAYNQGYRAGAEDSDAEPDMECTTDGFYDWLAGRSEFAIFATDQAAEVEEVRVREIATIIYGEVSDEPLGDLTQRRDAVQTQWYDAVRSALATQPATGRTMGGEVVAWRERDGDEWVYYDADSDTGKHIAAYQRDRHNISVFPLFAALQNGGGR